MGREGGSDRVLWLDRAGWGCDSLKHDLIMREHGVEGSPLRNGKLARKP